MREPDFKFYGIAQSPLSRNDMGVTVSYRDQDGKNLFGPDWPYVAQRAHRIYISKPYSDCDPEVNERRLNAYQKLLSTRTTNISDLHLGEGLNAFTTPTIWDIIHSRLRTLAFPLQITDHLLAEGNIDAQERVPIFATPSSDEPIAAAIRPRVEVKAVAPIGKKKNPNRFVLVPHPPPERRLFVMHSRWAPELIVTKPLRDDLQARFKTAISFYGVGHAPAP